jgi:hypothetical protein
VVFLNSVPLLAKLSAEQRAALAEALEEREYPEGAEVVRQVRGGWVLSCWWWGCSEAGGGLRGLRGQAARQVAELVRLLAGEGPPPNPSQPAATLALPAHLPTLLRPAPLPRLPCSQDDPGVLFCVLQEARAAAWA